MKINFTHPTPADLPELVNVENSGFTPEEAATPTSLAERITAINDTFILAQDRKDQILGYVVGPATSERHLTDDLFETSQPNKPNDPYIAILSLVVIPEFQGQGIASQLLTEIETVAKAQGRKAISLTCLEKLIPFYERNGYVNEGESASTHAGETWFNLVKEI
ncbi:acetyltransferase [Secundilactobacillus oryzae JCM 18671]|uniref:Acetyltransferase n=1 Tax=Secundilactobacillus oryzae JCM 18671 TaxID=1291743 RepID=A0A081BGX8_9LACO|nr:GNAT family N-acetyltransferase [Secundilactobacillus oryzae]GAK47296.1 acetyltransferase [Secundilactobacillus oryzae JCM 18671]